MSPLPFEEAVSAALRALTRRSTAGGSLQLPLSLRLELCHYLPQLLATEHDFWREESLDQVAPLDAWKVAEGSGRLFGLGLLITSQDWTPLEVSWAIDPSQDRFRELGCWVGSPGGDRGGLDRSYRFLAREEAERAFAAWRATEAEWVYEVRWPNPERAGSGLGHSRPRAP